MVVHEMHELRVEKKKTMRDYESYVAIDPVSFIYFVFRDLV